MTVLVQNKRHCCSLSGETFCVFFTYQHCRR